MFLFFNNCIYHVCQLLYYSIVHTLYIHGTDMSVHVYARWSGFQMLALCVMVLPVSILAPYIWNPFFGICLEHFSVYACLVYTTYM